MSGFVATAPTTPTDTTMLGNDGWFPDLSLTALRDTFRIDGTVTDERLREAARYAVANVNKQLAKFKADHLANGITSLEDVSADQLDGEPRLVMLYRRAVFCNVKADLIERYRDFDSTDSGLRRSLDMDPGIGDHRRNASWAVRDILGQPHTVAELI